MVNIDKIYNIINKLTILVNEQLKNTLRTTEYHNNLSNLKKIIDNTNSTNIQEYGNNMLFIRSNNYDANDEETVNNTVLLLLNKLSAFTQQDIKELISNVFEELRYGNKIIADLIQLKITNNDNKKKEEKYFNLVDTYKNYLVNKKNIDCKEEYKKKINIFLDNVQDDMTIDNIKSLFIRSMGDEFSNVLKKYHKLVPDNYKTNRIYEDIIFGKTIKDIIGLDVKLNCEFIESKNDTKINNTDIIDTIYDILASSYSDSSVITKHLNEMFKEMPRINIKNLDYQPEYKKKLNEYNNEKNTDKKKQILVDIILQCKQLLIGDRIETLKKWGYEKNSNIFTICPISDAYTNISLLLMKNFMMNNTHVYNIFPLRLILPINKEYLYENEFYSNLDTSYLYVGMICIEIETQLKVILIYKKFIDLIKGYEYKYFAPFEQTIDFSILFDNSKSYHAIFNSAIQKMIFSCHDNKQDITLKPEYDIFNQTQHGGSDPVYINKIHVYEIIGSNPKELLFSKYSYDTIKKKYREYNLMSNINNLREIPYSRNMMLTYPNDIGVLCQPQNCITFRNLLAKKNYTKNKYIQLKNYNEIKMKQGKYIPPQLRIPRKTYEKYP